LQPAPAARASRAELTGAPRRSVMLHADGWADAADWTASVVPRAVALLIAAVRYGADGCSLSALRLRSTVRVATLATPTRDALRTLMRESGVTLVFIRKPVKRQQTWQPESAAAAPPGFARGEAMLVLFGPPPILDVGQAMLCEWLAHAQPFDDE
jgi:hypothetical protein